MTTCGMCRWHPFHRASAPSKPCILATGHDGLCRDGWGGQFTGSVPRTEALDPADVDAMNEDAMPADSREDVPVSFVDTYVNELSVLMTNLGHPAHASVRIRQCDRLFSAIDHHMRDGGALPLRWRVNRNAGVSDRDAMDTVYDALSEALRERGGVVADRAALDIARREWERLDGLIRDGSPLPSPWARRRL